MSPRRNWDSPTPSLANECAPPQTKGGSGYHIPSSELGLSPPPPPKASVPPSPNQRGGGGTHSPAGERVGKSQFLRLEEKA